MLDACRCSCVCCNTLYTTAMTNQIDASNNRQISLKYRVMSYPTLLLFAPGIDGEPFADSRNMGILKGVMIGLVQVCGVYLLGARAVRLG
jgi:hypothetical protein